MHNNGISSLYELKDIKHKYGSHFCLDIPHLKIRRGSFTGLTGPNGSGKSTLMRILSFLEKPDSGSIYYKGILQYKGDTQAGNNTAMLIQEPYLLKRTVFENVAYGLKVRGIRENLNDTVCESLELVGLEPDKFGSRKWFELSGGEVKRVALASRLILKPEVLVLDEPLSNIDPMSISIIKEAIVNVSRRHGITLIISSHDPVWLNLICGDILRMYDGTIVGDGTENILTGPWFEDIDGLWSKELAGGEKIFAVKPPDKNSIAVLNPSEIIISLKRQKDISAQNMLKGRITNMVSLEKRDALKIDVEVQDMTFRCSLTQHAAGELNLIPGKKVWLIFKASSLQWQ